MSKQQGYKKEDQKQRPAKYVPNSQENKQVRDAMKEAKVPLTPENAKKAHDAVSGQGLDYKGVLGTIKSLFGK